MTSSRRIVIVTHYYPPHVGGIEFVARTQAEQLAARGHHVTVVTSHCGATSLPATEQRNGVTIHRVAAWNGLETFGVPFPVFAPNLLTVLAKAIRQADIVHIHDVLYESSVVAGLLARFYHKPVVLTQHVALVAHPRQTVRLAQQLVYGTFGRLLLRQSQRVLVLNDSVRQFVEQAGARPERIVLTTNSVNTELFHPAKATDIASIRQRFQLPTNQPLALFVGRLVPKKGFQFVLDAADSRYHLVFAGANSTDPAFKGEGISLLGPLDQTDLAAVYQAADVFVLPSQSEGFPLSLQEAMATGLPIITTDDPGYKPYGLDRQRMTLLTSISATAIRQAIIAIIDRPETAAAMQQYSLNYAGERFAPEAIIAQLERTYTNVIEATS